MSSQYLLEILNTEVTVLKVSNYNCSVVLLSIRVSNKDWAMIGDIRDDHSCTSYTLIAFVEVSIQVTEAAVARVCFVISGYISYARK